MKISKKQISWTFLSNYGHVLVCIAKNPKITIREMSDLVGITERGIQKIITELESAEFIQIRKDGRQNVYSANLDRPMRHPLEKDTHVIDVINVLK